VSPNSGLSREHRRLLDERGLVKLVGLIARNDAEEMAERLWREMAGRDGVRRDEPSTWQAERPAGFAAFQKAGAFKAMGSPELRDVLDDLIGREAWVEPHAWGQPLVCFPTHGAAWELPHQVWHFDLTPDPRRPPAMVGRVFLLLAPLRTKGGGTLVATGSHRIASAHTERRGAHLSSGDMRKLLAKEHPWFADLMSPPKAGEDRIARFMDATAVVDGVPLQVEEIVGDPGDVFLMHPNALHGLASNVLETPRLALSQTVYPKSWLGGG
jgi:hypothetical protein